ncbi:MAG: hypothetical protein ACI4AD_04750 [Roseburia sp.]
MKVRPRKEIKKELSMGYTAVFHVLCVYACRLHGTFYYVEDEEHVDIIYYPNELMKNFEIVELGQ